VLVSPIFLRLVCSSSKKLRKRPNKSKNCGSGCQLTRVSSRCGLYNRFLSFFLFFFGTNLPNQGLRTLRSDWDELQRLLNVDLPTAQERLKSLKAEHELASATAQEAAGANVRDAISLEEVLPLLSEAEGILRDVSDLDRVRGQLAEHEEQLRRVSSDSRTLAEVTKEYQALQIQR
jgi:hypothetical protein